MILRAATPDDLEALVDVQERGAIVALSHVFPQDAYPFPRASIIARWRRELADPDTHVYVSTDAAGAVNGFAATRGAELLHFGTAVETWGTGHAREFHHTLLAAMARTAPGGTTRVWLHVLEANARARRFYEKLDWRPTGGSIRSPYPPNPVLLEYERELGAAELQRLLDLLAQRQQLTHRKETETPHG